MYPEYLCNNDTQEIGRYVCEWASSNEPALRAHCTEVSRQTDTSSLVAKEDCHAKTHAVHAVLHAMETVLEELSRALSANEGVFHTRDGKADFGVVCHAIVQMEEERQRLLSCIAELTQLRRELAANVADANRVLHFLSLAGRAVSEDARSHYANSTELVESAYARLKKLDGDVREVQEFCMTLVESHLSVFAREMRDAADFKRAGEALDRRAIRLLCNEVSILLKRCPNITF